VTQAQQVSREVFVVDSNSTDGTLELLAELGCTSVQRPFKNYSDQRNWAIAQVADRHAWQLHLDADEVLDTEAIADIRAVLAQPRHDAYLIRRRDYFMGRMLRFSGVNPWHLRLFKSGVGQCEARLYDQHFVASTADSGRLAGYMHDKNSVTLSDWTARHNRWSDARERTRFIKKIYYRLPIGMRALSYFLYRYLLRLGFLDGKVGFYFAFFQALWFRMLVDAKVYEKRNS
jgi:glycosyltransferase involved in cell wall biosynthesis